MGRSVEEPSMGSGRSTVSWLLLGGIPAQRGPPWQACGKFPPGLHVAARDGASMAVDSQSAASVDGLDGPRGGCTAVVGDVGGSVAL